MNNFSFWLLFVVGLMLVASFFMPRGATAAGWTLYAPLTLQTGLGVNTGISLIGAVNPSPMLARLLFSRSRPR